MSGNKVIFRLERELIGALTPTNIKLLITEMIGKPEEVTSINNY